MEGSPPKTGKMAGSPTCLLHVDASGPHVSGDEHARGARPELCHDRVPLLLRHVAVHRGDGEVVGAHLLCKPVHLALGVAEDDRLRDGERVVEVAQRVKLPLLALHSHKELLDALRVKKGGRKERDEKQRGKEERRGR